MTAPCPFDSWHRVEFTDRGTARRVMPPSTGKLGCRRIGLDRCPCGRRRLTEEEKAAEYERWCAEVAAEAA